jgi:hypothetical protein
MTCTDDVIFTSLHFTYGGMKIGKGNRSTWIKPCPSVILSTTDSTWLDLGSNPGCGGGKPVTNRLSYGTANYVDKHRSTISRHSGSELEVNTDKY